MKISVVLEALTGSFSTDIDRSARRAEKSILEMQRRITGSIRDLAGVFGVGLGAGALVAFAKHSADVAAQQRNLAESVGITATEFSELNYAAIQSGIHTEELGKTLFRVNEVLEEAATKGGEAAKTLAKFGITAEQIRSGAVGTDEALKLIADKFNAMPDGIEKSALAADLLGTKLAQKLIPFLNKGSAGFEEMAKQGRNAGAVMDEITSAAVARANDKLDALGQTLQTRTIVLLAALAEEFGLIEHTKGDKAIDEVTQSIAGLNAQLAILTEQQALAEQGGIVGALFHTGDAAKIAAINAQLAELEKHREKLVKEQLDSFGKPKAAPVLPGSTTPDKTATDDLAKELERREQYEREYFVKLNEMQADNVNAELEYQERLTKENQKTADTVSEFWKEAAHNMQDSLAEFLFDPFKDGLEGMVQGFADALRRMAANALAAQIFDSIAAWGKENSGAGGFLGFIAGAASQAGGSRAGGGDVMPDRWYLTGENGPELIVPRTMSTVIPLSQMGGSGGTVQNFNISTPDANSFRASERQIVRRARQRIGV